VSFDGRYSNYISEIPPSEIDRNLTTKYLNFGRTGCSGCVVNQSGKGTDFFIISSISNVTVTRVLLFTTANDYLNRDPTMVTLEGSNVTTNTTLWTLIFSGPTDISSSADPGRTVYGT